MLTYNKNNIENAKSLRKNMTPLESKLWYTFLRKYPVRFQRQKAIGNYIADFYCAKAKLVVEVDGNEHYETDQRIEYDNKRTEYLKNLKIKVIRYSNYQINVYFNEVCSEIDHIVRIQMGEEI